MINRDAGDKVKGFNLQKNRAIYSILKSIEEYKDCNMFYSQIALEADDDVNISLNIEGEVKKSFEQDKNIESSSKLTFNSEDILKSLVNFMDIWISNRSSKNVNFIFYSTSEYGLESKKNKSKIIQDLQLTLPENPILEYLKNKTIDSDFLENFLKPYLIHIYRTYYEKHLESNIKIIEAWDTQSWIDFFNSIFWIFQGENNNELENLIIDEIRNCKFFNHSLIGKEELIYSRLEQELNKKMISNDYSQRFLHLSEIQLIFKQVESVQVSKMDKSGTQLDEIDITDTRDVKKKILDVCKDYNNKLLVDYKLRAGTSLIEEKSEICQRSVKSQKFQIYLAINDYILSNIDNFNNKTKIEMKNEIDKIFDIAIKTITEERSDYYYPLNNEVSVKNMVISLLEECYVAFDEE